MGLERFLVKGLRKVGAGRGATYPLIGSLPSDFQEKLIMDLNLKKFLPMATSLVAGACWHSSKYYTGDQLGNFSDEVELMAQLWAYSGFIGEFVRIGGAMILKKPVGAIYPEIAWFLTRKNEKFDRLIEDYILN